APAKELPAASQAGTPPGATTPPAPGVEAPPPAAPADPNALPPLESLTPHSDFSAFLRPGVEPGTRAQALKTLFGDPALYPMDRLDVYIDDYSQPDPLPEGWLEKLNQYAALDSVPAAEEAARKAQAEAQQARVPSDAPAPAGPETPPAAQTPAAETPAELPAQVPDAAPGTAGHARASDSLPPGDLPAGAMYRDAI
ncbi:MAG TPA: DUF3306 domain-containing protein, partial [Usitatibacter sp.]|nr:DUF3306 domain-containing protein [Usitatibacter sp.]